jgi:hypothetical protein
VALASSAGIWSAPRNPAAVVPTVPPAADSGLIDPARLKEEYHHDFRDNRYDHRWLLIEPSGPPSRLVKPDPRGLRIAIPAKVGGLGVGVFTRFGIHGDCEITTTFEVLTAEKPTTGVGVGPELYVRTVDGWSNYVSMYRWLTRDGDKPILGFASARKAEGKPYLDNRKNTMTAKAGRFRIVRVGPVVHYFVAEGTSDTFRELQQVEFVTKDFDRVRFMCQVNDAPSALDVLLKDLTIRAEGLPGWTGSVPQPKRFPWWIVVAAVSCVVALGVGLWWTAARKAQGVE